MPIFHGTTGSHSLVPYAQELKSDEPPQYLVAVLAGDGMVIRLAVPLGDLLATRARMRNRLLFGSVFGFVGCLVLSFIFIRALEALGLAWDVKVPSEEKIARRMLRQPGDATPDLETG